MATHLEPVNGATIDERRILTQTVAKRIANWTERYDHVKILATKIHEERIELQNAVLCILVSGLRCDTYQLHRYHTGTTYKIRQLAMYER
jgi:hypothetical protein